MAACHSYLSSLFVPGVEMDEDFEGTLEDVERDPNQQSGGWLFLCKGLGVHKSPNCQLSAVSAAHLAASFCVEGATAPLESKAAVWLLCASPALDGLFERHDKLRAITAGISPPPSQGTLGQCSGFASGYNETLPNLPSCMCVCVCADDEGEEEEDGDRLDQQMGEAGDAAEAVDERMWDDEDKEEQQGKQVRVRPCPCCIAMLKRLSLANTQPPKPLGCLLTARFPHS